MPELININHLQQWIGKTQSTTDTVTAVPVTALGATLDHTDKPIEPGFKLPELWHWLYFLPMARQSMLGADGHPTRGGFLPPVPLPRRMWAGSQFEFHQPVHVGDNLERISTIENVVHKSGRSGELVFVRVKHQIYTVDAGADMKKLLAITEYHDIVYRQAAQASSEKSPTSTATSQPIKVTDKTMSPVAALNPNALKTTTQSELTPANSIAAHNAIHWEHLIEPDDVLLFRYSALTFNGHRIHYDRRYVTEVEGYPGLIVHGPLIATLLLDALNKVMNNPIVTHYEFKAIKPVFDIHSFYVCGAVDSFDETNATSDSQYSNATDLNSTSTGPSATCIKVRLWAKDHLGDVTMEAIATVKKNTA